MKDEFITKNNQKKLSSEFFIRLSNFGWDKERAFLMGLKIFLISDWMITTSANTKGLSRTI